MESNEEEIKAVCRDRLYEGCDFIKEFKSVADRSFLNRKAWEKLLIKWHNAF